MTVTNLHIISANHIISEALFLPEIKASPFYQMVIIITRRKEGNAKPVQLHCSFMTLKQGKEHSDSDGEHAFFFFLNK